MDAPTPDLTLASLSTLAEPLHFALLGVAPAAPTDHNDFIHQWLANGAQGQMSYLANNLDKRLDPRKLLPGAKSIICIADFHPRNIPTRNLRPPGEADDTTGETEIEHQGHPIGRIARYAWGNDYHKTIKNRLFQLADRLRERFPNERFKCAVDTAPILEREHAARAGLGWIGKHTLTIHPAHGSYMLLGEIITTLAIETSSQANYPDNLRPPTDHCGTCTRCIDACPTDCITPYQLNASRCISYLTIEHRTEIEPALAAKMDNWIAGCDICQEVCPHNRPDPDRLDLPNHPGPPPVHPAYTPRPPAPTIDLLTLLQWTEDDRRRAFTRSALKRIKLDMLKRNALIAAGNALKAVPNAALHDEITRLAHDGAEPQLVRLTAQQVLKHLSHVSHTQDT